MPSIVTQSQSDRIFACRRAPLLLRGTAFEARQRQNRCVCIRWSQPSLWRVIFKVISLDNLAILFFRFSEFFFFVRRGAKPGSTTEMLLLSGGECWTHRVRCPTSACARRQRGIAVSAVIAGRAVISATQNYDSAFRLKVNA